MNVFTHISHGVIAAIIISLPLILRSSFGEARHLLSIIGAIAIFIASGYILRTRLIRWGRRQTWLKYHQKLAAFGLTLVLIHSAARPEAWHSWLTFLLALLNLGTGVAVSLTAQRTRRLLLRCHLALAPILLISIVLHGNKKLDHDEFFPLTQVHDIPCVRCHTSDSVLFRAELIFPIDLDADEGLPEDLRWMFESNGISLSEDVVKKTEKAGQSWSLTDSQTQGPYHIQKTGDQLSVRADSAYKSYSCVTCHEHDTPEIRSAHEIHGVTFYARCFICHQTEIDGKRYGKQKANWEYDSNW